MGKHLRHVVHFAEQQVFPGASIYTCLLFLAKEGAEECRFVKAADLEAWKTSLVGTDGRFAAATIGKAEWNFTVKRPLHARQTLGARYQPAVVAELLAQAGLPLSFEVFRRAYRWRAGALVSGIAAA